jgi:hypothetical protein
MIERRINLLFTLIIFVPLWWGGVYLFDSLGIPVLDNDYLFWIWLIVAGVATSLIYQKVK